MNKDKNLRISVIITKSLHEKVKKEELNLSKYLRDSLKQRYKIKDSTHTHTTAKATLSDININKIIKWFVDNGFKRSGKFHIALLEKAVFPSIVGSDKRTIKKYISLLKSKHLIEEIKDGEYELTKDAFNLFNLEG